MKSYIATVQVEFTCTDEDMVRSTVIGIPFGDHDCGFKIVSIEPGVIPVAEDETCGAEYRTRHGCTPIELSVEALARVQEYKIP